MSKPKFYLLTFISFLILIILFIYFEKNEEYKKPPTPIVVSKTDILKKVIGVEGMTCLGCEVSVEKAVSNVKGVIKAKASLDNKSVTIEFDKSKTDVAKVKKAIAEKGYEVR